MKECHCPVAGGHSQAKAAEFATSELHPQEFLSLLQFDSFCLKYQTRTVIVCSISSKPKSEEQNSKETTCSEGGSRQQLLSVQLLTNLQLKNRYRRKRFRRQRFKQLPTCKCVHSPAWVYGSVCMSRHAQCHMLTFGQHPMSLTGRETSSD